MRKVFIALAALIALLVAAVLIGPGLIDWNAYKAQIADAARDATGRQLSVRGDISFRVLPTPKLVVEDVGLANVDGGRAEQMVRLKSLDVRVSLGALLGGKIQVQSVTLVEPTISLEVLADGRRNWDIVPPAKPKDSQAGKAIPLGGAAEGADAGGVPDVRLDRFIVTNGTLLYSDAKSGFEEKVEALNAIFSAGSLEGPFETSGDAVVRRVPVSFVVSAGQIIEGRTVPINATVKTEAGAAKVSVSGVVLDLNKAPRFKGKVTASGGDLAAVAAAVAAADLPPLAAQAFSVAADVNATAQGAEIRDVALGFGDVMGAANVNVTFGDSIGIGAAVHFGHVDLDALLAAGKASAKKGGGTIAKPTSDTAKARKGEAAAPAEAGGFSLPSTVAASLALTVDAVTVNGGALSQAKLNAELVNGEITISQASVQAPGSTDVALFGFVTAVDGKPRLEGDLEAAVGDTRGIARWVGADLSAVPADRLRTLAVKASVAATPDRADVTDLKATFDGSTLTGGLVALLGGRPSFGADVTLDRINVDAYLGKPAAGETPATGGAAGATGADSGEKASGAKAAADTWKALAALKTFDANVKAHVKQATVHGIAVRDTVLDATLHDGTLTLRRASVADAARAAANVTGTVKGLGGIPDLDGVSVALTAADPARLVKLAGGEASPALRNLGAVKVAAQLNGSVVRPTIKATVDAAGGQAGFDGVLNLLPLGAGLKGTVSAAHPDTRALLTALGDGYRPVGQPGALSLTGQLDAAPDAVSIRDLKANIGKSSLGGDVSVALAAARPKITATLNGGVLDLTAFEPAAPRRAAGPHDNVIPVVFAVPGEAGTAGDFPRVAIRAAAAQQRWPTEPLDLSALRSMDADVALQAKTLAFKAYQLDNADIRLALADGVLTVSKLNGGLFGGTLASSLSLDARVEAKARQTVSLKGVDVAQMSKAATGKADAAGRLDLDLSMMASGRSVSDLVSALAGKGTVKFADMDVRGPVESPILKALTAPFTMLNDLFKALGGAKLDDKGVLNASFVADKGIFSSRDLAFSSNLGEGTGTVKVDLPGWWLDAKMEVGFPSNGILGALLSAKGLASTSVPIGLRGDLDSPKPILPGSLTRGGLPIPGVDKLLGGKAGAIGNVLQGILGGGSAPKSTTPQSLPPKDSGTGGTGSSTDGGTMAPPPPPPGSSQQQQQKQQTIDPRQLLKGLLGR